MNDRPDAAKGSPADGLRVTGLILAAGRSTRMGRPKTALVFEDRTLLDHAIDSALESQLSNLVVVLRTDDEPARRRIEARADDRIRVASGEASAGGLGGSLRIGLSAVPAEADAAAVLLADQPGVGAALIDHVIEAAAATDAPAARPVFHHAGRRTPGHPVVLRRALFAEASRITNDEGARALFRGDGTTVHEVAVAAAPRPDVDTPDDYLRLVDGCDGSSD